MTMPWHGRVRDAAFGTQVTLSVGQLMDLAPIVRTEVLNGRSNRPEAGAANIMANLAAPEPIYQADSSLPLEESYQAIQTPDMSLSASLSTASLALANPTM